jgi:hypothetical protein
MPLSIQKMMIAAYVWLRIALSYCVVGAVIVTLASAYLQVINLVAISSIMTTSLAIGIYKAEMTRRKTGLNNYFVELSKHKHSDF